MKKASLFLGLAMIASLTFAAPSKGKNAGDGILSPGTYEGTVKAFVCEGCAEWVQSRLEKIKGLSDVTADQKTKVVRFTIDKGSSLKKSDIQKALDKSADEMGMGADYTIDALHPVKK